jgi:hypothetical protein
MTLKLQEMRLIPRPRGRSQPRTLAAPCKFIPHHRLSILSFLLLLLIIFIVITEAIIVILIYQLLVVKIQLALNKQENVKKDGKKL